MPPWRCQTSGHISSETRVRCYYIDHLGAWRICPLIGTMTRLCFQLISMDKLSSLESPLSPILGNPHFTPGLWEGSFGSQIESGCFQTSHTLQHRGAWPLLQSLMDHNGPFHLDIWRALQSHNILQTLPAPDNCCRNLTTLEDYCSESGTLPHAL